MLLIKNANLDGTGKIVDILIGDDGKYKEIAGHIEAPAGIETIDATGMMACPTFVNTHMHFDKAYTSYEQGRESYGKGNWISSTEETLEDSIYVMHDRIRKYTPEAVAARAERAIKDCVMYGTTKLRTNVDISTLDPNLNGLKGVLMAKEATKDICDLQVIAFPQEGIICDPGTDKLLEEAMEMGCDVMGGMPAAEMLDEVYRIKHIDRGIFAEGLGCVISAFFGGLPCTSYTQNIGIISATGVCSRRVTQIAGVIFLAYGLCPKLAYILSGIPRSVIGAVFLISAATIMFSGIDSIISDKRSLRNTLVAGTTLALAIMLPYHCASTYSAWAKSLPAFLNMLCTSTVFIAVVAGVLLNLILNYVLKDKNEK